jgi:tetratricopeptide (TPR) repeat protein
MSTRAILGVLALVLSTAALAQAGYASRSDALAGLAAPDAMRRAEAVIYLAVEGTPSDEAPLRRLLFDDNPRVRELAEQAVWLVWSRSGDESIDVLMAKGTSEMRAGELDDAIATFSEVIRRKPAFAEGWNKRATVLFMAGEMRKSLADCDEVLKRNPHHFGALSGYGHIYFHLEQYEKAVVYWKRALAENPNMPSIESSIELVEHLIAQRRRNTV